MTIGELQTLCAEWQRMLGLQDWLIDLKIVRAYDFDCTRTLGTCEPSRVKRRAKILVLDVVDSAAMEAPDDQELTLVHELLHIQFHFFQLGLKVDTDDPRFCLYEQAIDATARALINMKREAADG